MKLIILNGPNLNLLGKREVAIYGNRDFAGYFRQLQEKFSRHELSYFQSNHEGELVDKIQETGFTLDGLIINGAGFSHTSVALADAIAAVNYPAVEVHISNVYKRETFRHHSYLTANCDGIISGLGLHGYEMAIEYLVKKYSV